MAPQIGVLALQGAVAEHARALLAAGADVRKVRRPAELEGLDGLVVPGGESTAMARLAAPVHMMPAIRQRLDDGMAVFGTCAGLILTADAVADAEALKGFERIGGPELWCAGTPTAASSTPSRTILRLGAGLTTASSVHPCPDHRGRHVA